MKHPLTEFNRVREVSTGKEWSVIAVGSIESDLLSWKYAYILEDSSGEKLEIKDIELDASYALVE